MKINNFIKALAIVSINFGGLFLAPAAIAQDSLAFEGTAFVEKTILENGAEKTVLLPTDTVVPGDLIVFNTAYRNDGAETVNDFVVTNPVPDAVAFSDQSGATLTVSVDGGQTFGQLSALSVAVKPEGQRPAVAADVTHIRWTLDAVAPGQSGTLSYKAIVR